MKTEYPYRVLYEVKWTTEDLFEIFVDYLEDIDMEPLTDQQQEKLFNRCWNETKDELIDAEPPSEWGSPYHDIIAEWVRTNEDFLKFCAINA